MGRAYKRHYLEVLFACTKHVAERLYGERPASVIGTAYDWTHWYHNHVRMRNGDDREVCFNYAFFKHFQAGLNLGMTDETEEMEDDVSPAEAIRRAYAGLKFPPQKEESKQND